MFGISWPELHGALTHFPVALLITAAIFEVGAVLLRKPIGRVVSFWLLVAAVAMAVPALMTGWITGGSLFGKAARPPDVFVWHRAAVFTASGLALLLLAWRARSRDQLVGGALTASVLLILVIAGVIGFAGYLGGRMVFGTQTHEHATEHEGQSTHSESTGPSVDPKAVQAGQKLFQSNNCLSCHKMNGRGGTLGPELTQEGRHHADIAWQIEHLKQPDKLTPGSVMPSFAHLKPDELKALATYLVSRK